ncbi:MAG: hypothetical protein OEY38_06295 [Gammaproteobacteria bacterium]|nr:hypothetical protein [Gammaproteobacteria bacterium]
MKNRLAIVLFITSLSLMTVANASSDKVNFRLYAMTGYTFVGNSLSETYGSGNTTGFNRTNINGGFGFQTLTSVTSRLSVGIEGSFNHWINETASNKDHPNTPNSEDYCYHGINTLALMELKLSDTFFIQAGSGLTSLIGPNTKFGNSSAYFMIAPGMNIQLSKNKSIPLMIRLASLDTPKGNFATGDGFSTVLPVSLVAALNWEF